MNDLSKQDTLELEVQDFGPIVDAQIDLRPLTVFVGPSNTGKSYLAILIYALHRYFSGAPWSGRGSVAWSDRVTRGDWAQKYLRKSSALTEFAKQILEEWKKFRLQRGIVVPTTVADMVVPLLDAQPTQLSNEIGRCFSMRGTDLLRKGSRKGVRFGFRMRRSNDLVFFEHEVTIGTQRVESKSTETPDEPLRIDIADDEESTHYLHMLASDLLEERADELSNLYAPEELMRFVLYERLPQLIGPLCLPAFYLPADRTGVMHAHSAVVSAIIESASMTGLRPATRTPMLSGVLSDFLQQLIEIDRPPPWWRRRQLDLGAKIEEAVLGGSVHIDRSELIGYPRFTYQPRGWKERLPLMNASSMVSELAPVVLYLRHMVRPDNVLIIEEPESHLHPAMQVEFTRQLAEVVRSGVRVIVTTHSEWVLEELANIVRRSALPEVLHKETASTDVALRPDEVGAWLFKPKRRPKGSVVEEMKLDVDTGLYASDYDTVSEALYNENVRIYNHIQSGNVE